MMRHVPALMTAAALMGLSAAAPVSAAAAGLAQMRWHHRVLLLFAPDARVPALARQRAMIAAWRGQADDRDLVTVSVIGDAVQGVSDDAEALRRKYKPTATGFTAILIGKDGGEKLRSTEPLTAARLEAVIDAMPMRQGGER